MPNPQKKAKKLMQSSERLKKTAAEQEKIGRYEIDNKVPKRRTVDNTQLPHGMDRIKNAERMRKEATRDSLQSVRYSQMSPSKKKK
jgi:hypothetical protein